MQSCSIQTEGSAASADAHTGASGGNLDYDVHVDVVVNARVWKYTETHTKPTDNRSRHVLADDTALPASGASFEPSVSAATVGADAVHGPAQHFSGANHERARHAELDTL